jgi:hypothetical protein
LIREDLMLRLLYGDSPTARDLVLIHLTAVIAAGLLLLLYAQSAAPSRWQRPA